MNDWTDKINVEDGKNVDGVENDSDTKEAEPSKACHLDRMNVELAKLQRIMDRKIELDCP